MSKNNDNKTKYKSRNEWTSEDKFQIVLETSTLNETKLAVISIPLSFHTCFDI